MAGEEKDRADELRKEIDSLKARVVELEEKLSKHHVTEEEWKTYRKVAAVLAGQAGLPESALEDSAAESGGRPVSLIRQRKPPHLTQLFPGNIGQVHSIVGPYIIVSGFGDLGF
jgi:hypothetical protein